MRTAGAARLTGMEGHLDAPEREMCFRGIKVTDEWRSSFLCVQGPFYVAD
jgi:hypothetical protein